MGIQAEIMQVALDKYLGSEDQWCVGSLARDVTGASLNSALDERAVTHCAEGAIAAATWDVMATNRFGVVDRNHLKVRFSVALMAMPVRKGVEKVLVEQHPDFVKFVREAYKIDQGDSLTMFNDGLTGGMTITSVDEAGVMQFEETLVQHPGVGYEGIKAAFEKYRAQCEEQGL